MLKEVENIQQVGGFRRWFSDDYMDLIVWFGSGSSIAGFQICYGRPDNEHALTWYEGRGFCHNRVDDGELPFHPKMTPILVADGIVPARLILEQFEARSGIVDSEVRTFVCQKLKGLAG